MAESIRDGLIRKTCRSLRPPILSLIFKICFCIIFCQSLLSRMRCGIDVCSIGVSVESSRRKDAWHSCSHMSGQPVARPTSSSFEWYQRTTWSTRNKARPGTQLFFFFFFFTRIYFFYFLSLSLSIPYIYYFSYSFRFSLFLCMTMGKYRLNLE